jgi:uncharacterized protein YegP (UPF0339 family)
MPKKQALATLVLRDNTGKESCHKFTINPDDALIRDRNKQAPLPYEYIHQGGDSKEAIDVVILAEGYTAEQMDIFMQDAINTKKEILSYQPFRSHTEKFNFILYASNGNPVIHSHGYSSKQGCKKGIEGIIAACKNPMIEKTYLHHK